jgi:hypothetical protein
VLDGVSMPAGHQGLSWFDGELGVRWRADEIDCITDAPIKPGGILTTEPHLSDAWWATFNRSLDAVADQPTRRVATSVGSHITQERITTAIHQVFPDVDTRITDWTAAHADLASANLTAPSCYLLDWEDWGLAPRGYDASTLWGASLAVPALAKRVYQERRSDLDSRSGRLAQLYYCAEVIAVDEQYGSLLAPAIAAADVLTAEATGWCRVGGDSTRPTRPAPRRGHPRGCTQVRSTAPWRSPETRGRASTRGVLRRTHHYPPHLVHSRTNSWPSRRQPSTHHRTRSSRPIWAPSNKQLSTIDKYENRHQESR